MKLIKIGSAFLGFKRQQYFLYMIDLFFYDNYPLEIPSKPIFRLSGSPINSIALFSKKIKSFFPSCMLLQITAFVSVKFCENY